MLEQLAAEPTLNAHESGFVSLQTSDVDEFVGLVNRLFGHHRIVSQAGTKLNGSVVAQRCNTLTVGQLQYGVGVALEVDEQRPGWVVTQALSAEGAWDSGRFQPGELMMFAPQWCGRLDLAGPTQLRNTFIPSADMRAAMETLLGAPLDHPLTYSARLAPGSMQAKRLGAIVELMFTATGMSSGVAPVLQQIWQRTFAMELLALWPHSYSRYLQSATLLPRALRRACDYIEAHLTEAVAIADVARAASVGVRALELGFAKHLSQSPSRYIRNRRLDAARQDLSLSRARRRIADVALKWGFSNAGVFAKDYRERFGELPSKTRVEAPQSPRLP